MNDWLSKKDTLLPESISFPKTKSYTILDKNVELVVEKMISRSNVGKQKYGTTTERTDLSTEQWLTHLQEELMDACIYIQKLKGLKDELIRISTSN